MCEMMLSPDDKNRYDGENGYTLKREYGLLESGVQLKGEWVYRDQDGKLVDYGAYRVDVAKRCGLALFGDA